MPVRKRQYKKRKYRKNVKTKDYASNKVVIYRNPGNSMFMPPRYRTVLTLNGMAQIPIGLGSRSNYMICKLNSIYQPFSLGLQSFASAPGAPLITGLSPAGSDKLSSIYSTYRVTASSVSVMVLPTSVADEIVFALAPALPGAAALSVDQLDAVNFSKGPKYSSTYFKASLGKYVTVKNVIGNQIQGDLSQTGAAVNTDPAYLIRWDMGYRTLSNADLASTISVAVKLKYWVDFFEIKSNNIEPGA